MVALMVVGIAAGLLGLALVVWPKLAPRVPSLGHRRRPIVVSHAGLHQRGSPAVGRRFCLVTPITRGRGRVELGGRSWAVSGPVLPAGRIVEVSGVNEAVLEVRPAEPLRAPHAAPEGSGHAAPA